MDPLGPFRRVLRAFRLTRFRPDPERDVRDEIEFYLEMRARELMREGMEEEEARAAAREAFGDVERIEARVRTMARRRGARRGLAERLATWVRDVGFALRGLARNPGFAGVAVLTLALGIGANTAIFSLVDAAMLRSPPVESPEELVMVYTACRDGEPRCSSSYPDFLDYREQTSSLEDLAAYSWVPLSLGGGDARARLVTGQVVSGGYFGVLGVEAAAGRLLQPADGEAGGDPAVDVGGEPDVWIPMQAGPLLGPPAGAAADPGILERREARWIAALVGRRADGAPVERVRDELAGVSERLGAAYPRARDGRGVTVDPARRYALPVHGGTALVRFVSLLSAVVGVALFLACASLANLLLARAAGRVREIGIRMALGAGKGRVTAEVLRGTAGPVLLGAAAGLAAALAAAPLAARFLFRLSPTDPLNHGGVVGLLLAVAAVAALVPARRASRVEPMEVLAPE